MMSTPNSPETEPGPPPTWKPDFPVHEPEPDRLPDEDPKPNPDENENPPVFTGGT